MAGKARRIWGLAVSWIEPASAYKGNICLSVRMIWIGLANQDHLRDFDQESWTGGIRLLGLLPECVAHLYPN